MSITIKQLNILRHAIGYDDAGNDRWHGAAADDRRNHFVTGPGSTDFPDCQQLAAQGLMTDHGPQQLASGNHCFTVTDAGRQCVALHHPKPEKISAGRRRYLAFLDADSGLSFIEWLKRDAYLHRMGGLR